MSDQPTPSDQMFVPLEEFIPQFERVEGTEAKLRAACDYMHKTLNEKKPPYFKGFWEVRKLCLPLFKEQLEGTVRAELWNLYTALTREGRELKQIVDHETNFAVRQIDLAISSLEEQLTKREEGRAPVKLPSKLKALAQKELFYVQSQEELNRLNLFATRVNALRKELSKTQMRAKQKNSFFQRLSLLGDQIFPERKEWIHKLSESFLIDVESFVESHFSETGFSAEKAKRSLFFLRDEIKGLQAAAKILTVNTKTFGKTRETLSSCWDKLRGMEKELKREQTQSRAKSAEKAQQLREQIDAFDGVDEATFNAIEAELHSSGLMRQDVQELKEELAEVAKPLYQKREEAALQAKAAAEALANERKKHLQAFTERVAHLKAASASELSSGIDECRELFDCLGKTDKAERESDLVELEHLLLIKHEESLLALSTPEISSLDELKSCQAKRQQQRHEIKERLEEFRRLLGGSGLDFQKSIELGERVEQEKEQLSECELAIENLQKKIDELKGL